MNLNIGDKVVMVNCYEALKNPDKVWTVRSKPFDVCGCECVMLEGKSGGFEVDCLELVK